MKRGYEARVIPCLVYFRNLIKNLDSELEMCRQRFEALESAPKPSSVPSESAEAIQQEPSIKLRIPELQEFHGQRSVREVENFI